MQNGEEPIKFCGLSAKPSNGSVLIHFSNKMTNVCSVYLSGMDVFKAAMSVLRLKQSKSNQTAYI